MNMGGKMNTSDPVLDSETAIAEPLYTPQPDEAVMLRQFIDIINKTHDQLCQTYDDVHSWSVECPEEFW